MTLSASMQKPATQSKSRLSVPLDGYWFGPQRHAATGQTTFGLYAPNAHHVSLVLDGSSGADSQRVDVQVAMTADASRPAGWFSATVAQVEPGQSYGFVIDDELRVPDPASRWQPDDVHCGSVVVASADAYPWHCPDWQGRPFEEAVIMEVHVGTATPEGTFAALQQKLDYYADLGVTALELMPLADFPGPYNWGYDGVLPFAPDSTYGTPDDLRALIDAAHQRGLMMYLDVVYNHFGPEGNYMYGYAAKLFNRRQKTPWGDGLQLGRDGAGQVLRRMFIENACYWLCDYRFDGLRLDAVHALDPAVQVDFLTDLALTVRATVARQSAGGSPRHVHLMLENDFNQASLLSPGLYNAQWNDDAHHAFHVTLTGECDGYYADYHHATSSASGMAHLGRCLAEGFAYQGEPSPFRQGEDRGEASQTLPPTAFINFLQNHDQIGNRAFGDRLSTLASEAARHAAMALLLLSPAIPMLFMGEAWQAETPFLFFCDLGPHLNPKIVKGRRNEFAHFAAFADQAMLKAIPDPTVRQTVDRSTLNWQALDEPGPQNWLRRVRQLLALRRQAIWPLLKSGLAMSGRWTIAHQTVLTVSWHETESGRPLWTLVANLSDALVPVDAEPAWIKASGLKPLYSTHPGQTPVDDPAVVSWPAWAVAVWAGEVS
ncbi:MAG: malto-oligosyltrehalose trehalohydrolase [Cyanobacteria bacterium HKST-UBA04]|nr:malto-oligosyltrehalose trehalohydrolase [Cyanobacteria bacterium HKST-UBA04]